MQSRQKDTPPPPETARGGGNQEPGPASARERMLWQVWDDVRRGTGHFHQRGVPVNRLGQFVHGLCLPFHVARALLADPTARRRYLAVGLVQAAVIVALGVLFTSSGKEVVETVGPEDWSQEQVEEAQAEAEAEADEALEQAKKLEKAAQGAVALAVRAGADEAEVRAKVDEGLRGVERAREERRAAKALKAAREGEKEAGKEARKEAVRVRKKRTLRWMVYLAALLSSLHIAQWIVIALSRDFHTALGREASLLTGLEPEDGPFTPRVHINVPWLWNKTKRRWQAAWVISLGVPLLWVFEKLVGWQDDRALPVLMSVWGAWWFVVYTAGKSSLAWSEQAPPEPWFLRGWHWLTARVGPLRGPMGVYGSLWANFTRPVFAPVASVERQPWSFCGLAVVRALAVLPLVKCFLRPIIPVAAAHLLVAGAAGAKEGSVSPPSSPEP